MTALQIKVLAIARRDVEKLSNGNWTEPDFRLVLRNIGGVKPDAKGHVSSKALSHTGFERVMGHLESLGFRDRVQGQGFRHERYWRDRAAAIDVLSSSRQVREIQRLAAAVADLHPSYSLAGFCRRFSEQRQSEPENLSPRQARQLIECLKHIATRGGKSLAVD